MPARRLLLVALAVLGNGAGYAALSVILGTDVKRVRALVSLCVQAGQVSRTFAPAPRGGTRTLISLTPGARATIDAALRDARAVKAKEAT